MKSYLLLSHLQLFYVPNSKDSIAFQKKNPFFKKLWKSNLILITQMIFTVIIAYISFFLNINVSPIICVILITMSIVCYKKLLNLVQQFQCFCDINFYRTIQKIFFFLNFSMIPYVVLREKNFRGNIWCLLCCLHTWSFRIIIMYFCRYRLESQEIGHIMYTCLPKIIEV